MAGENTGSGERIAQTSLISNMLLRQFADVPDWQEEGLCIDSDLDPFFDGDTAEMLALCNSCPVLNTCRAYREQMSIASGVSGGIASSKDQS